MGSGQSPPKIYQFFAHRLKRLFRLEKAMELIFEKPFPF